MSLYSFDYVRQVGMRMLAAEGSGGGTGTLKDQLQAAETARDTQTTRADQAEQKLKTEQEAHVETKASLGSAEAERDKQMARADKAEADLKAEQEAHNKLKAKDTTATGKAAEQLARNGIPASAKEDPATLEANAGDPVALWTEYAAADPTTQAQMRTKHGAKLDEAAVAYDAAQKAGR